MNHNLKLQAWLDGELSESEMQAIAEQFAQDIESKQLVAELTNTRSALAGNELPLTVPETRDFYWSKIQREIQRQPGVPAKSPAHTVPWKRWLAPLAGLGALTCVILLIVKPLAPVPFDEIASGGNSMDAVTFHDQTTGTTVVWLEDHAETVQPQAAVSQNGDADDVETE